MCLRDLMASAQRGMGLPNWEPEDDPEGEVRCRTCMCMLFEHGR